MLGKKLKYRYLVFKKVYMSSLVGNFIYFIKKFSFRKNKTKKKFSRNYAIYDLRRNPITFDFVHFLGGASFYFNDKGKVFTTLIVNDNALHSSSSPWENYTDVINSEKMNARIFNLLLPIAFCFMYCKKSIKLISPEDLPHYVDTNVTIYPQGYKVYFPTGFKYSQIFHYIHHTNYKPPFSPPEFYSDCVDLHCKEIASKSKKKIKFFISLTLRSYNFQKGRNTLPSDIVFIRKFCLKNGIGLIVIPDTDNHPTIEQMTAIGNNAMISLWDAPSNSILLRFALYENVQVNIFNNNGPNSLAILGEKSKGIILNFGDESHPSNAGKKHAEDHYNIRPYSQPYERFSCLIQWKKQNNAELETLLLKQLPELEKD